MFLTTSQSIHTVSSIETMRGVSNILPNEKQGGSRMKCQDSRSSRHTQVPTLMYFFMYNLQIITVLEHTKQQVNKKTRLYISLYICRFFPGKIFKKLGSRYKWFGNRNEDINMPACLNTANWHTLRQHNQYLECSRIESKQPKTAKVGVH